MFGEAREQPVEITAGELPSERFGGPLVMPLEGQEVLGQGIEVGEVVGSKEFALNHREVDLDLVEPRGVSGQMDEFQVGPSALEAFHRACAPVRGAAVHDPEDALGGGVRLYWRITSSTSLPKGSMPFWDSQRPKSLAR